MAILLEYARDCLNEQIKYSITENKSWPNRAAFKKVKKVHHFPLTCHRSRMCWEKIQETNKKKQKVCYAQKSAAIGSRSVEQLLQVHLTFN